MKMSYYIHKKLIKIKCPYCKKRYSSNEWFKKHLVKKHKDKIEIINETQKDL